MLAAVLIYRPLRTWIDQVIVARCLHPNLRVQEIRWHRSNALPDHSIIQATHFDWGATEEDRCFGITAENAWIVVADEPLLNKAVSVPKAVLTNSRLFLETLPDSTKLASLLPPYSQENSSDSIWQRHLDSKQGDWDWHRLRKHLDNLLQTDAYTIDCSKRLEDWLSQSGQIAQSAEELSDNENEWNNPLRDPSELELRLGELDKLQERKAVLLTEFQTLKQGLEQKVDQIGQVFEQQRCERTSSETAKDVHLQKDEPEIAFLAAELLKHACSRNLSKISLLAEIADRLCRAAIREYKPPYDRDFRSRGQNVLTLSNLTAQGMFRCDPLLVPFQLSTHCSWVHTDPSIVQAEANFKYQFDCQPYRILVSANNRSGSRSTNDLQVELCSLMESSAQDSGDDAVVLEPISPQWSFTSDGKQVNGTFEIDARIVPFLFTEYPEIAHSALQELDNCQQQEPSSIRMEFSGSWRSLVWNLADEELPFWLIKEIILEQQRRMLQRDEQRIAQVEKYFHSEIDRMEALLGQLLDHAKLQSQQHSATIMATRATLHSKLSELKQLEFARQPKDDIRR